MKHFFTLSLYFVFPLLLYGQSDRPIAVFLGVVPDQGRIHDDIAWVLFVDDVLETDVAVGFIAEPAAWVIEGRRAYMGYKDTILIAAPDPDSPITAQYRIDKLEMGLARFAAKHKRMSGFTYHPKTSTLNAFEQVKDPAKQWVFRLGANGSINLDYFKDQNPATGRIGRSNFSRSFISRFSIWRVLPRRRFTFDWGYSHQYLSVDYTGLTPRRGFGSSGIFKIKNLNTNLSWACGIGKRFSLGSTLNYNIFWFKSQSFITTPPPFPSVGFEQSFNTFSVAPGAEFNVFPYSRFLHEFLIVGYAPMLSIKRIENQIIGIEGNDALYLNGGIIRKWGYLSIRFDYFPEFLQSYDYEATSSLINANTLAFNLSKGLLVTLNAQLNMSTTRLNNAERSKLNDRSFSTSLGFHYYFGNKGLNMINPRFGRTFNRTSI